VIAVISAVIAGGWAVLSLWLGREQERRAREAAGTK
jgi:hypothetical protein